MSETEKENIIYQAKMAALAQRYHNDGQKWSGGDAAATREWVAMETGRLAYWKEIKDDVKMFFANRLDGTALARWRRETLPEQGATEADWEKAIREFLAKQVTMAECVSSSNRAAVLPLTEKWKPGESLDLFYERLSSKADQWQFLDGAHRDKLLLQMLIASMPPSTEQLMLQKAFSTSSEALVFLHQYPPTLPEVDSHQALSAAAQPFLPETTARKEMEAEIARLTQQVQQLTSQVSANVKPEQNINAVVERENLPPPPNQRPGRQQQNKYCTYCKSKGHTLEECKWNQMVTNITQAIQTKGKSRTPLSQVRCYNCNEMGHYSYDCPEKRNPPQGANRRGEFYDNGRGACYNGPQHQPAAYGQQEQRGNYRGRYNTSYQGRSQAGYNHQGGYDRYQPGKNHLNR